MLEYPYYMNGNTNGITIRQAIKSAVETAAYSLYSEQFLAKQYVPKIVIDRPADSAKGDYSTNIALAAAKVIGIAPVEFAIAMVAKLNDPANTSLQPAFVGAVEKVEVAGPGFINFYIKTEAIVAEVASASKNIPANDPAAYGRIDINAGRKLAYEYTDPNPFKVFHIGHLMSNIIGESLSRIGEYTGGDIRRFCYQGDLGRHVALFVYGLRFMDKPFPIDNDKKEGPEKLSLVDLMYYMGTAYAKGATHFKQNVESNPELEQEVQAINKKLYERSDEEINAIYDLGREWSLEYFEMLYALLGTKFDRYFFESACVEPALKLIEEGKSKGVFVESEGAIVFEGEKFEDAAANDGKGEHLHTRVFITKFGLPTYDAKELGLAKLKYDAFQYDKGIVLTANEQDQYYVVNLKVQSLLVPEITGKNIHVSHGMMVLPTGKMSSRTGDVVSGQETVDMARDSVLEIMKEREMSNDQKQKTAYQIAIAGLKYLILRQASGKNIVYDAKKALSFDGDSGPYLQYACVRARSVIAKAKEQGIEPSTFSAASMSAAGDLARKIFVFPEIIERAYTENAPHHIATHLIELAGMFNAFYANNKIIDATDDTTRARSSEYVALTQAIASVLTNGLYVLGIEVPEKM